MSTSDPDADSDTDLDTGDYFISYCALYLIESELIDVGRIDSDGTVTAFTSTLMEFNEDGIHLSLVEAEDQENLEELLDEEEDQNIDSDIESALDDLFIDYDNNFEGVQDLAQLKLDDFIVDLKSLLDKYQLTDAVMASN